MSATQSRIDATHLVLLQMPELLEDILKFLPTNTIYKIQGTCSQWKAVITTLPPPFTKPVAAAAVSLPPSTEIHLRLSWYESSGWYFRVSRPDGFRVRDLCEAIRNSSRQMYRSAEGLLCAHLKVLGVLGPGGTTIRKNIELRLAEK
ncbi:hypothetical protein Tdes44962_MAKER07606 [Teratosphaeria destructans]|uniref:F-box domain-containing protein n=1 Tax=Teratosphaeria destructans TaxID=418781 RepID=A0A9W7W5M1_9PEZI|nr:hypothetical protein Tdes44962_MAKER07606 [Teratosphaeria destructans]